MWTTGAGFGIFGCATCGCCSCLAGSPPGGSQRVTITSTMSVMVSITSMVVVTAISCLFSSGIVEDKANKAPKARVVDSFMTTKENALDANEYSIEGRWVKSVMESTGDCTVGWI